MATVKLLLVFVTCLLHGLAGAQAPRGNPARGGENPRGFPRAGRHPQAIQSLEFNGITVLHEDLLHSMSPVQEKLDITSSGISVTVRFQFDETMMHPNGKPQNRGSLSIVHNQTEVEVLRMPLYYDSGSRTQLRGDIRMSQEARRTLKKKCPDTTCVVHVSVNNRGFGRSTVIELGKLKVYKKSSGKTTFKLLTYPHFVEGINKGSSWESFGFTWSAAFHFFLVIGAGLMLLIAIEAWRVHGMISRSDDGLKVSKRWLQVALVCSLLYLGMSGSRALDFVSMGAIVIAAPAAAVVGIFAFCFAGGPIEEDEYVGETPDEDYMGEDEDDTQSEETEETKKTI